ncbi:MAG TPA: HlyD family efflux transporter periplasmic adaptor subunit [Thermoanaerobaculia bacterium]|jgi:HlyD family secretion protein|nr:HlyD family efflux transporter periplasmic adaptor subunit [Thermoanaerobaculia bacterium]
MQRILWVALGVVAIGLISYLISRLKPAAPSVERETVWVDTVQRGPMLRQVRGPGTLVPVDIRWLSASQDGRVERIPALPGVTVQPDTILLELSNPELQQGLMDAESQLQGANADFQDLQARLESDVLNQRSQAAAIDSQAQEAKLQAEANQQLAKDGLIPDLTLRLSRLRADQLGRQAGIETQRVTKSTQSAAAQLNAQRARVAQAQTLVDLRRRQVDGLNVRAGISGILQQLPVQVGQRVTPGTNLARVARPEELKAELRIPETQAKDIVVGQTASIDTRNGIVSGRVARIAPSVQEGTVTVDVALTAALPKGARPDLSVDGTIEIERLPDVLFVGRPAYGQPNSKVEMFKLVEGGKAAVKVPVQLGRSSVNTIELVSGLQVGDQVILSDTSAWDNVSRIKLD